ncbi:MAG: NrfD/PsrC family molybdoenzyme membrane anchor subunit [Ktedonobacterales bacterium]
MQKYEKYDSPPAQVLLPALWRHSDTASADDGAQPVTNPVTYYGRPMIHKPLWRWYIPLYFVLGGVAGGAAMIGAVAHFLGGEKHRGTVRDARYLTPVIALISAVLLIADLHRPLRFFNMLRVFKLSSPLSVGTWILTAFGMTSGALAGRQAAEDNFILPRQSWAGRLARSLPAGPLTALWGLLGLGLGGYTGTLLAVTAVPLWAAGGVLLGPLFLATALASGAAALTLMALGWGKRGKAADAARAQLETVEEISALAQLGIVAAREVVVPARINKPLRHGLWGRVYQFGAIGGGMATPLLLRLIIRLSGRRVGGVISAIAPTLALLGALAERFAITEAGKQSADDPLAYQELTRGTPGEARPTAIEQGKQAPQLPPHRSHVAALDS